MILDVGQGGMLLLELDGTQVLVHDMEPGGRELDDVEQVVGEWEDYQQHMRILNIQPK